jgi:predicted DNA-binding protein
MNYDTGRLKPAAFSLRLTKEMREDIQRIADREKISPAFVVRKAVEKWIEEDKNGR